MIGKLILTSIIIGIGAFFLLSDSFEEFISPYADASVADIENIKNDPIVQSKFNQSFKIIYDSFTTMQFLITDFFRV